MKKILGAATLTIAMSHVALAQSPFTSQTNWSGPYAGIALGFNNGSGAISDPDKYAFFDSANGYVPLSPSGIYGVTTLGMNWQHGAIVAGLEGDYSFGSASAKSANAYPGTLSWGNVGTARARLGYAEGDLLLYATGGLAVAGLNDKVFYDPIPCGGTGTVCSDMNRLGSVFGVGIEMKLKSNLSLKAEYTRINFGDLTLSNNDGYFYTFKNQSDFVKFGINYHF